MSIFDPTSGKDQSTWLKEKSLAALESAVKLIDLANESDTTPWYRKNLRFIADHLITRLLPMTALFHGVPEEGVRNEEWDNIIEKGTFELARWCRKWDVANPYDFINSLTAKQRDESEIIEKQESVEQEIETFDDDQNRGIKLEIYQQMAIVMLHRELSDPAKRILSWALFHLNVSKYPDIVVLSKTFLPTDIGCTQDETADGYKMLYEKGLIEKVKGLHKRDDAIALRLVVGGLNDSKHAVPYEKENFGREGLRIGGESTTGNVFYFTFDKAQNKYLKWLAGSDEKIQQLKEYLQNALGKDRAYIEDLRVIKDAEEIGGMNALEIQLRYPFKANDRMIEQELEIASEKWIRETIVVG